MKMAPTTSERLTSHPKDNIKINMYNYLMMFMYRLDTIESVYNQWWNFDKNVQ